MEQFGQIEQERPYAERKLSEMLEYACSQIEPGHGYSLTVDGLKSSALVKHELEALFGAQLDDEKGATVSFGFDESTEALSVDAVSIPIFGIEGRAKIVRNKLNDQIPYVHFVEVGESNESFVPQKSIRLTQQRVDAILSGFSVEKAPPIQTPEYTLWRSELLSQSRGWYLSETQQITTAYSEDSHSAITISNNEFYSRGKVEQSKRVTTSTTFLQDSFTDLTQHINATIELVNDMKDKKLRLFQQSYQVKNDFFDVYNDAEVIQNQIEAIILNEDSFSSFRRLLDDTADHIEINKSLKNHTS